MPLVALLGVVLLMGLFLTACQSATAPSPEGQAAINQKEASDLLATVKQRGKLRIGCKYDTPPFGYLDADGELKGFEIDLAHELAQQILGDPSAIECIQVHTATRIAALDAKHVDFILATMTITPERAEKVDFSPPYYTAAQGVMVKKDSPYQTTQDLKTQSIAFVLGATSEGRLKTTLPQATLKGFKSHTEAFSAFNAGRTQAFSTDDSILYGFLSEYCGVKLLPDRLSEEPYGMAFRKDKESDSLQDAVNTALSKLQKSGQLKTLQNRWMKTTPPSHCS